MLKLIAYFENFCSLQRKEFVTEINIENGDDANELNEMLSNPIFVQKQVTVNDSLKFDDNLQIHQNVEGSNFGKYNSR